MRRSLKTRLVCLLSAAAMIFGAVPVSADMNISFLFSARDDAQEIFEGISYDTGNTGRKKDFKFVAPHDGIYMFFTDNQNNYAIDPKIVLFDFTGTMLYENDDDLESTSSVNYDAKIYKQLSEGETVYLRASMSNGSNLQNYKIQVNGWWFEATEITSADGRSSDKNIEVYSLDDLDMSVSIHDRIHSQFQKINEHIKWELVNGTRRYSLDMWNDQYDITGYMYASYLNGFTHDCKYRVAFSYPGECIYEYNLERDYIFEFNIHYNNNDEDHYIPYGDHGPEYYNYLSSLNRNTRFKLDIPDHFGISNCCLFSSWDSTCENCGLGFDWVECKPLDLMYRFLISDGDGNGREQVMMSFRLDYLQNRDPSDHIIDISPDQTLNMGDYHWDMSRDEDDQQIIRFTPSVSGSYTIFSIDGVSELSQYIYHGRIYDRFTNPYVALFDSELRCIGCNDNIGDETVGLEYMEILPDDKDRNFELTADLVAGQTYYFAIPIGVLLEDQYNEIKRDFGHDFCVRLIYNAPSGQPVDNGSSTEINEDTVNNSSSSSTNESGTSISNANSNSNPTPTPSIPQRSPSAPAVVREPGVAGFVERLYTVALERPSDPAGKQDWIDAITLRGETGASCARGFLYSPEFLNKGLSDEEFVAVLYRTFFDREPDQAGFNAWVGVLRSGTSKEEVIEGFINSTEWANLCLFYGIRSGGTGVPSIEMEPNQQTINFATRLYTTCLGRSADQAGLMAWARQLANQRDTGTGAAHGFFFSSEFTGQNVSNGEFVRRLYLTFMDREPDQAGYDAWVAQLDGGTGREEVFRGFADSIEFARICAFYGIIK